MFKFSLLAFLISTLSSLGFSAPVISTHCTLGSSNSLTIAYGGPIPNPPRPKASLTWNGQDYAAEEGHTMETSKVTGVDVIYVFIKKTTSVPTKNPYITKFHATLTLQSLVGPILNNQLAGRFEDVICTETHGYLAHNFHRLQ